MKPLLKLTLSTLVVLFGGITGCTSVAPGAEQVRITKTAQEVQGCKVIGTVEGVWGAETKLKNDAFAKGADTVYITNSGLWTRHNKALGMAYNCRGTDLRQPVPVQIEKDK